MESHETREKTGETGGVRMGLLPLPRPGTSQLVALGLALLLLACSRPATGDLGYDPERDPAADLQALVETAQARGTRILVVVGGDWCSWCHILDRFVKGNQEIHELWDRNFETLKVYWDPDTPNKAFLGQYPRVDAYPHIYVLDGDGRFLHSQNTEKLEEGGSYSPERMREFLTRWAPRRAETD
jgi:hypothetical protein